MANFQRYAIFAYQSRCTYKVAGERSAYFVQCEILRNLLQQLRVDAELTQAQLASRIGRDQAFVSKYESGERRLDVLELREVCRAVVSDFAKFIRKLDRELK